jgi:hypothetical protein
MRMRQAGLRWQHGSMGLDREARRECLYSAIQRYSDTAVPRHTYVLVPIHKRADSPPSHLTRLLPGREIQKIRFRQEDTTDSTFCWPWPSVPQQGRLFLTFLTITTVELNCGLDSQNAGISPKFSGRLLFLHLDGWGPIGRRRLNGRTTTHRVRRDSR